MRDSIVLSGSTVVRRCFGTVEAEVDGELVMLGPKDLGFFGAKGTGAAVWELVDGERDVDAIVAALEEQYEAAPGVIRTETLTYLEALVAAGLAHI